MLFMKLRHLIIFFALLLACAIWFRTEIKSMAYTPQPTEQRAIAPDDAAANTKEQLTYEAANQARSQELNRMEQARARRSKAAELTQPVRAQLRVAHQNAWAAIISSNQQTYSKLLYEAAHSKTGRVPCTICAGTGDLDSCILCQGTGKCPTCGGTGKVEHDDCCPTCLGTGKCYLCAGKGKMTCPFCDDGVISAKGTPPSKGMPLN
jgi:hypothetical protein